jgi:thiol-disulfide isomerase/thioredoxin
VLKNQQIKLYLISIILLFLTLTLQASEEPPLTHSLTLVDPPVVIPSLKLENMDEELIDIKSFKGKTIVINFWATWCPPCRREMFSLEKLHLATKDKNVVVLAINIGEDIETVFPFVNTIEPSPTFPILFDTDSLAMERWKVVGLPTTYVIDPQGMLAYKAIGGREFNHPDILEKVSSLDNLNTLK